MTIYRTSNGYELDPGDPSGAVIVMDLDGLQRLMRACLDAGENFSVTPAITADEPLTVEAPCPT